MFIIAGPPGAGKSSVFSLAEFANRSFNADDRAAELNGGSYRDIPLHVRRVVNGEFEKFVRESIEAKQSFALETTLRSDITFEQAKMAKSIHGTQSHSTIRKVRSGLRWC
jgi:predicted ABC-type ATPase